MLDQHIKNAATPYGLRESTGIPGRFLLTRDGRVLPSQYGSMDRDTALRVYKMFRDAWNR